MRVLFANSGTVSVIALFFFAYAYNCLSVGVCAWVCACVLSFMHASTVSLILCLSVIVSVFSCPFSSSLACFCYFVCVSFVFVCLR